MLIENRHKKLYSEKLFNELCIIYLLMDSDNTLDSYVLDQRFGVSKRTMYRYIEDINASLPALNLHFEGKNKHRFLTASLPDEYDDYELSILIIKTLSDLDVSNDRLRRCILLVAHNEYSLENVDHLDEADLSDLSENDYVQINDEQYVFCDFYSNEKVYEKTSLRTKQRDVKLVKDVLVKLKSLE